MTLHKGEIVRDGVPADVWASPESAFVAWFLGLGNIIDGEYKDEGGRMKDESGSVGTSFGLFTVKCAHKHIKGDKVHLLARPLPAEREPNIIQGVVTDVIFQQDRFKVTFDNGLYVYMDEAPKMGQKISVTVKVECLA